MLNDFNNFEDLGAYNRGSFAVSFHKIEQCRFKQQSFKAVT